jgi:hypothetical protein
MAEARLPRHAETECSTGVPASTRGRAESRSRAMAPAAAPSSPQSRARGRRMETPRKGGENGSPSLVVSVRTSHGGLRSVALRRLEANSHRSAPRAVQIAQRRLARRRSWYEPGCRHRPQGGPAEMPVSEHARRARERVSHASERDQGPGPLSGGAVLIGGEGTDQLGGDALGEAEDDVDGGPRSARHSEATAGRASSIVGDRCDGTVRRALRGTAQVPDLRGARRVSLRRGGCQFARRSTR